MGGRGCAPVGRSSSGAVGAAVRWRARPIMKTLIAASDAGREKATATDLQTRGSRDGSGLIANRAKRRPGATLKDAASAGGSRKRRSEPLFRAGRIMPSAVRCDPRPRERRPPWPTKRDDPSNNPRPDANPREDARTFPGGGWGALEGRPHPVSAITAGRWRAPRGTPT